MNVQLGQIYEYGELQVIFVEMKGEKAIVLNNNKLLSIEFHLLGKKIKQAFPSFGKLYKCIQSYEPQHEDEIQLEIGDIIQLMQEPSGGWAIGRQKEDKLGFFPIDFMEPVSKQHYAITEFYQTQTDYIRDLMLIKDEFILPIQQKKILTEKLIELLFCNLLEILEMESGILKSVELLNNNSELDVTHVCQLIAQNISNYYIYIAYGSNTQEQLKKLKEITVSHKVFKGFMEEKQKINILKGLDLASFLIKPVQRLCKIPLLLKEMKQAACLEQINNTIVKIQFVINVVNEGARKPGSVVHSPNLNESFKEYISEHRVLLRTIECKVIVKGTKKVVKVFIFNDLLLLQTKDKKKTYSFPYKECEIGTVSDTENENSCVLELQENELSKLFILNFNTNAHKLDFVDLLKRLCLVQIGEYPFEMIQKHYLVSKLSTSDPDDAYYGSLSIMEDTSRPVTPNAPVIRKKSILKTLTPVGLLEVEKQLIFYKNELEKVKLEKDVADKRIAELESQGMHKKSSNETISGNSDNTLNLDEKEVVVIDLKNTIVSMQSQITQLTETNKDVHLSISNEKRKSSTLLMQINKILDENEDNIKKIKQLETSSAILEDNASQHQKLIRESNLLTSSLQSQLTTSHTEYDLLLTKYNTLQVNEKEFTEKMKFIQKENDLLHHKLISFEQGYSEVKSGLSNKDSMIIAMEKELSNSIVKNEHLQSEINILNNFVTVLSKSNQDTLDIKHSIESKLDTISNQQLQHTSSLSIIDKLQFDLNSIHKQNAISLAQLSKYKFTFNVLLEWFEKCISFPLSEKDDLRKLISYGFEIVNRYCDLRDSNRLLQEQLSLRQ